MNSDNNQATTPQPAQQQQQSMCTVSGENMPVGQNSSSPMQLMQSAGNMMNPHQPTPPPTPLVPTPQGGAPTPTPSSTPSPMPPPQMQSTLAMQQSPQQQMQVQNASANMCPQPMVSQPMCSQSISTQPMVTMSQAMCSQPMVSQSMCSVSASQAMGSMAGSVAMNAPVYSMPVSQSMCSLPVSGTVCSIPQQQNITNTTLSNVHPTPLQQVQVIQQPLHNQYLQHLYASQPQMILPGNLTIQNLGGGQGLSLQLQQQKPNLEHKGAAGGGPTIIPASSMQAPENYMENYQSLQGVTISSGNMVSASGQMITSGAKTCVPSQMLTASARPTAMLQGQAGFAPQAGGQTVVIGQLGMLSNQASLMPAHNKALADQQKGKTFIMNQQATLQPKSPILPQPVVTSAQVLSNTQLKQLSSPQLITSQAPAPMIGGHTLFGNLQALSSLPPGLSWATAGGLQPSALLGTNTIIFRGQQSDVFTQAMQAVPAAAQANVQPQMQQQVAKPKQVRPASSVATQTAVTTALTVQTHAPPSRIQPKPRNRGTHARSVGVQQQVMPRPLIPQMATSHTQTQTQVTQIAPQLQQQYQQQQQQQQHHHHHHQQIQFHHHHQQQQQMQQKADACNQTRPAATQMKTTSTSTEPKGHSTVQMGFVNIAPAPPAPPPQVSVPPVNIVVAQSQKMVTTSTNTSPTHQTVTNNVYVNGSNNTQHIVPTPTIHLPPPPPPPPPPIPVLSVAASTNTEKRTSVPPQMVQPQPTMASVTPQVIEDSVKTNSKENSLVSANKSDETTVGNQLEKKSAGISEGDASVTNATAELSLKDKQPQKAIVKPHVHDVLTHVIEGYIIQEGSEPFPVARSSLLTDTSPSKLNANNNEKPIEEDSIPTAKEMGSGKVTKKKKSGMKSRKGWRKSQNARITYNVGEWQQQTGEGGVESNHVLISGTDSFVGDDSMDGILTRKMGGAVLEPEQEGETTDTPSGPESSVSPTTPSSNREEMEVDMPEGAAIYNSKSPIKWTVQEVVDFVRNIPGCSDYADEFRSQEIDGQALMLLKEDHLMTAMNMKLGPALKICARINSLRDDTNR